MSKRNAEVLLVDDDAGFRSVYRRLLTQEGYVVIEAKDPEEAAKKFHESNALLALVDLMLPPSGTPEEGARLCEAFLGGRPRTKVIVVSGTGDSELPLSIVERGAYDFIQKPVDPDVLLHVLARAHARAALEDEVESLSNRLCESSMGQQGPIGASAPMQQAKTISERAAPTELPVLITGETGTGKEVFARFVHEQSRRNHNPFIAINCGAIPENLLESALFGHVKGSFTGAVRDAKGYFREADGGTLFLDEIGDMAAPLQVKLLRALENAEVTPVGAAQPIRVDVRIISATNQTIDPRTSSGQFREDLYYRIRGIEIALPRLAERTGDMQPLAQHFLGQAANLVPGSRKPSLSGEVMRRLESYDWPGNLRELRTELQRALVMAGDRSEILLEDLSPALATQAKAPPKAPDSAASLEQKIAHLEEAEIRSALQATNGNKSQAALRLGLSRQGLLNKIARYGIAT